MNIEWIGNNNFFPGRNGNKARYIILHGTAGGSSAVAIANYFKSTEASNNPVSSHYIIDQQGIVVQCVSEQDGAWANGYLSTGHDTWWDTGINPNNLTISIEHVKSSTDNSNQLTAEQAAASVQLIKEICARNNIPGRMADSTGGITGHFSIDPVNRRLCPNTYPWQEMLQFLKGSTNMIPTNWSDDGTLLHAPNGETCNTGFRGYILTHEWNSDNTPNSPEIHVDQVQLHNLTLGAGTRQTFRDGVFWWTQSKGVIWEPYTGLEIQACYDKIAVLENQIVTNSPIPQVHIDTAISQVQNILANANNALVALGK